jgi:hypothetical protein
MGAALILGRSRVIRVYKAVGFGFSGPPITRDVGDHGDFSTPPLPYPSQIGVGLRGFIPSHPRLARIWTTWVLIGVGSVGFWSLHGRQNFLAPRPPLC